MHDSITLFKETERGVMYTYIRASYITTIDVECVVGVFKGYMGKDYGEGYLKRVFSDKHIEDFFENFLKNNKDQYIYKPPVTLINLTVGYHLVFEEDEMGVEIDYRSSIYSVVSDALLFHGLGTCSIVKADGIDALLDRALFQLKVHDVELAKQCIEGRLERLFPKHELSFSWEETI